MSPQLRQPSVLTLHGVCEEIAEDCQITRSFIKRDVFERILSRWSGRRPELSIDDATHAAAEAALLAVHYGFRVKLFVNKWQVKTGHPYYLHLLNAALDQRGTNTVRFNGENFALSTLFGIKQFRLEVKKFLQGLPELEALNAVYRIATSLLCDRPTISRDSTTLTVDQLAFLRGRGVEIHSHGFSHRSIAAMSDQELLMDISSTATWVSESFGTKIVDYAVPFGKPDLPCRLWAAVSGVCYLADKSEPIVARPGCINRVEFEDVITRE